MKKQSIKFKKYIAILIIMLFTLSACSSGDDLPKGAKYLEPIWFDNLTEYVTGNYNTISDFKDGLAVVTFAQMGEYWSVSDKKSAIIDKSGEILWGPEPGDLYINILNSENIYIQDNDNLSTSKIIDIDNNIIGLFDGKLGWGISSDGQLFNEHELSCYSKSDSGYLVGYGLTNKTGQVIVPCKYKDILSDVDDDYIVFIKDEDRNSADVYNSDGSFSHSISLGYDLSSINYRVSEYKNGLFKIEDSYDGYNYYGLTDINGNIILYPYYDKVEILSEDCIVVSESGVKGCQLVNNSGQTIKNLDMNCYYITEMVNDVFMLSDGLDTYLITSKGDIIKKYENDGVSTIRYPKYCGDGIFSIECGSYYDRYYQLIDSTTGEFIGEKYGDRNDIIFNEGYAFAEDLEYNSFVIDKKGNKYCEGYEISNSVSDRVVKINGDVAGIICLPPIK